MAFFTDLFNLLVIVVQDNAVDRCSRLRVVFFHPDGEVHFSALQRPADHGADFHFLFPIERYDTCRKV